MSVENFKRGYMVLSLDLGDTIGLAHMFVRPDFIIGTTNAYTYNDLLESGRLLRYYIRSGTNLVVVEKFPQRAKQEYHAQQAKVREIVEACGVSLLEIPPGHWKPLVKRQPAPAHWKRAIGTPKTQHEKDALAMIWWHIAKDKELFREAAKRRTR